VRSFEVHTRLFAERVSGRLAGEDGVFLPRLVWVSKLGDSPSERSFRFIPARARVGGYDAAQAGRDGSSPLVRGQDHSQGVGAQR
jgi:hypothetical protein